MKSLFVLAPLALVACKSHEAPPPKPPPDPLAAVIVSAGAEPRHVVRYAMAKGTKTDVELTIDASLATGDMKNTMPVQTYVLETVVEDLLPDGRMKLRSTIVHALAHDTEGASVEAKALAGRLASLEGTAITATLAPDGKLGDIALDDGGKPQPDAAQLLAGFERVAMTLPHEPIGVGARWTSARELAPGGVKTTASSTIDVTALDATKLGFHVTTELHGADQQVTMEGVAIDVAHIAGTGSGQGTIDLERLANTSEMTLALKADMTAQGQTSPMQLELKTKLGPHQTSAQGEHSAP